MTINCQDPFEELNSHLQIAEFREAISLASSANKNTDEKEQRDGMSLTLIRKSRGPSTLP